MNDEFTLTLNSPITEEQWDMITDVDFDNTNEITFHTKYGKEVKFVKASAQPEPCEDAVSRKELLKLFSNNTEGSWTYDTVAIGYIKALPSVMPERHTCDTCKHYPPSKKWPCVDCNMRNPTDRWETDMR